MDGRCGLSIERELEADVDVYDGRGARVVLVRTQNHSQAGGEKKDMACWSVLDLGLKRSKGCMVSFERLMSVCLVIPLYVLRYRN